jgi:transposase
MSTRADYSSEQQRRLLAGHLFDKGYSRAEVGRQLGVSRQAAGRWYRAWQTGGREALLGAGRSGTKSKLNARQLRHLTQLLTDEATLYGFASPNWNLAYVTTFIKRVFQITYEPSQVHKILRAQGWTLTHGTSPEGIGRNRTWVPPSSTTVDANDDCKD